MRRLMLYAELPQAAIEAETPAALDPGCARCDLREGVRTVCMADEGEPGGLLIVGDAPGRTEDALGRPFLGDGGKYLRSRVRSAWEGPIALAHAVRCAPGKRELKPAHVAACRPYLAATVREVAPRRVVVFGADAALAVTGRAVNAFTTRRAYTHLFGLGDEPVPVFFVMHPLSALRNRFVRAWFEDDLAWALTCQVPLPAPVFAQVRVVETPEDAAAAVRELRAAPWAAFDVETAGAMHTAQFRLLSLAACARGAASPWVWDAAALVRSEVRAPLAAWLEDARAKKLGQNTKYDVGAVGLTLDARTRGVVGDTRLWRKLLEPESDGRLEKMAELVGMGGTKEEAQAAMGAIVERVRKGLATEKREAERVIDPVTGKDVKTGRRPPKRSAQAEEGLAYLTALERDDPALVAVIREDPVTWERWAYGLLARDQTDTLLRYNGRDAVTTARLGEWLEGELARVPEVDRIRQKVVDRAGVAIERVERWGIAVDAGAVRAFDAQLAAGLAQIRKRLDAYGEDFNPDSPKQVGALLFEKLGLRSDKVTESGQLSTDASVLEALADQHPVARDLVDWRRLNKLRGTYAGSAPGEGMLQHVRPDGRIHTSILLDGAATGRTSSASPNCQNIPRVDTPEGKRARDCFVAPPGHKLVSLDYGQLELRVAAALSQDPEMIKIFVDGVDYHQRTAELVSQLAWGIPPERVEKKHRSAAKTINFGCLYGMGDGGLAAKLGSSKAEATRVREAIMGQFRVLDAWIKECLAYSKRTGLAWTYWEGERARRRPLWRIGEPDDGVRVVAEHGAHNTPVQGTASEYCVASLAACVEWIEQDGIEDRVKLVLPVHDQLLFEVRDDMVEETIAVARDIMTGWDAWGVPLVVDVEVGPSWGSMTRWPPKP